MIVIQNVAFLKAEVCNETKLLNVLLITLNKLRILVVQCKEDKSSWKALTSRKINSFCRVKLKIFYLLIFPNEI